MTGFIVGEVKVQRQWKLHAIKPCFMGIRRHLFFYLIWRKEQTEDSHYLSMSVSLEESRNPLANGLLSIFSLVI